MDVKTFFDRAKAGSAEQKQAGNVAAAEKTLQSLNGYSTQLKQRDAKEWVQKSLILQRKANEVMHTENTGYGAEFIPDEVFAEGIIDIMPAMSSLLPLLPGNHGVGLPKKYTSATFGS